MNMSNIEYQHNSAYIYNYSYVYFKKHWKEVDTLNMSLLSVKLNMLRDCFQELAYDFFCRVEYRASPPSDTVQFSTWHFLQVFEHKKRKKLRNKDRLNRRYGVFPAR